MSAMPKMQIIPVILSGGLGTRLWPLSRKQYPKQYLPLVGDKTMLQETILRLSRLDNILDPIIICNSDHRFIVAEQCNQIGIKNRTILLEPIGRNTAPAITASAIQSIKYKNNAMLLVLSADHIINDIKAFHQAIKVGSNHAKEDKLVVFGVVPHEANTGYGYIKSSKNNSDGAFHVKEFVEKPDFETAKTFLDQGNYLWNSGMFMFQSNTLIDQLNIYSPDIVKFASRAVKRAKKDLDFIRLDKESFRDSPSDSIDCALIEKSDNVVVVPLDAGWSDVGSWQVLYDIGVKDINGNVLKGDVITKDTTNSFIYASKHMVTTVGIDNLIVIDTPDATFIGGKDKMHKLKSLVKSMYENRREEALSNRKVYRPWGWYDSIESGENFQVKRLHVNPGSKLSHQMHNKRAEHWVIISGTATVINGNEVLTLIEGDSTYIPIGVKHGLENKTNEKLEIIEVQSGAYLGEDDIVRFEDIYGRINDK